MDLMNLGQISRKTGLKAKNNAKRESNGMEDLNEFFQEGSDSDNSDNNGPARRLNFKQQTYKSPKRSMAGSDFVNNDVFAPVSPPNKRNSEYLKSLETLSPITDNKKSASVTKRMVLGRNKKRISNESNMNSLFGSDDDDEEEEEDIKPVIEKDQLVTRKPQKLSQLPTQPSTQQDDDSSSSSPVVKRRKRKSTVPDDQPVRRSTRHKIPTLAFWRNEKIVYNSKKENGAVVREIQDVIQVPEQNQQPRAHQLLSTSKLKKPKTSNNNKPSTNNNNIEEEYDSDPELEGSEWYKKGSLSLEVFEGPGSDKKVSRVVAWTSKSENYISRKNTTDNFNLAVLFDQDREFAAAGMLELPIHGVKLMKNNDDTYFMFYVVNGLLEVTLNDATFIATKGCSFEVPMGNMYQLENKGRSIAKMFFVQAKYVTIDPNEEWD